MMSLDFNRLFFILLTLYSANSVPINNAATAGDGINMDASSLGYLRKFGYIGTPDLLVGQLQYQQNMMTALKTFQRFAGLPETGKLDDATTLQMSKPRCGMADLSKSSVKKRKKRFTKQGTFWKDTTDITWALENHNNDGISDDQVRVVMRKSFAKWSAVTNLNFRELIGQPVNTAKIRVRFEDGAHGDPYPFDGPGGTLAHAFYPHNNRELSGDVHFDDAEAYTIETTSDLSKRKILWVAVHELGHSIGLEHSSIKGAIMYPWYQHFEGSDFDLTHDDIEGIQHIYGSRKRPTKSTVGTNPNVTPSTSVAPKPHQCSDHMGAVLLGRDKKTYVFNNNKLYVLHKSAGGIGIDIGPIPVSTYFSTLTTVDAVFRRHDGNIVLFHGDEFTVYNSKILKTPSRKISDGFQKLKKGFRDIDAAFVWSLSQKLYIFKGENYWRFSRLSNMDYTVDYGYPQNIAAKWYGLPKSVDAVFEWSNGQTYFFKDEEYYRWDKKQFEVHSGYPQKISKSFMQCSSRVEKLSSDDKSHGVALFSGSFIYVSALVIGLTLFT